MIAGVRMPSLYTREISKTGSILMFLTKELFQTLIVVMLIVIVFQQLFIWSLKSRNKEAFERLRNILEGNKWLLKVLHKENASN